MVVGFIQGPVKLYRNDGKLAFSEVGSLTASGKVIEEGDGGPCVVDWNGDGILDLLMGSSGGGVRVFYGKEAGSLNLSMPEKLVASSTNGWQPRKRVAGSKNPFDPFTPGVRTKPFASDWNNDGKLDLLVGDYISVAQVRQPLTPAEKKEVAKINAEINTLSTGASKIYARLEKKAYASVGKKPRDQLNKEEQKKYISTLGDLMKSDKEYQAFSQKWQRLYSRKNALEPQGDGTGFVWVYLRK
jgi:hypothetical protein